MSKTTEDDGAGTLVNTTLENRAPVETTDTNPAKYVGNGSNGGDPPASGSPSLDDGEKRVGGVEHAQPSGHTGNSESEHSGPVISAPVTTASGIADVDWENTWNAAATTLPTSSTNRRRGPLSHLAPPPYNVNQIDASELDDQLTELLRAQFLKAFVFLPAGVVDSYRPEIDAVLDFFIFWLSIASSGNSPGNKFQNITFVGNGPYRSEGKTRGLSLFQKTAFGVMYVLLPWGWKRLSQQLTSSEWGSDDHDEDLAGERRRRIWLKLKQVQVVVRVLGLLNFVVFLYNGRYRSLTERLLKIRTTYLVPTMMRQLSFDYMNRHLVWNGLTEFLLFVMPLVNPQKISRAISRLLFNTQDGHSLNPALVNLSECALCGAIPVLIPFVSKSHSTGSATVDPANKHCPHVFCYYCIKAATMDDESFACVRCNRPVGEVCRFSPP